MRLFSSLAQQAEVKTTASVKHTFLADTPFTIQESPDGVYTLRDDIGAFAASCKVDDSGKLVGVKFIDKEALGNVILALWNSAEKGNTIKVK